jgi:hypothetical protein
MYFLSFSAYLEAWTSFDSGPVRSILSGPTGSNGPIWTDFFLDLKDQAPPIFIQNLSNITFVYLAKKSR